MAPPRLRMPGMLQPVAEQVRLQRAGQAVLAEHDEHEHVGRHRHGQHEGPVEPAPAGEVVERDEHGEAAADDERADADADAEQQAVARAPGQQGAGDLVEGLALADEAGRQGDERPDDEEGDDAAERPPSRAPGAARAGGGVGASAVGLGAVGQFHPTSSIRATASSSSGPASSTAIGSIFDVGPVGDDGRPAAPRGWRRTRCAAAICSWASGEVRYSMQRDRARRRGRSRATTPTPDTLAWAPAPSWSGHAGRDREVGVLVEGPAQVVVVAEADVAVAGGDDGQQLAVGVDDLGVVGHPRPQQRLGRPRPRLAIMSATSDWLYSLFEVRRQVRPWNCGSPRSS